MEVGTDLLVIQRKFDESRQWHASCWVVVVGQEHLRLVKTHGRQFGLATPQLILQTPSLVRRYQFGTAEKEEQTCLHVRARE